MFCLCGCGEKVKPGNRYINGHNRKGIHCSEETKRKMKKSQKGHPVSEEQKRKISKTLKGHLVSEETRKKISENSIIHGRDSILNHHKKYKKEECLFNCESEYYCLHHEPPIKEDILNWEGKLINLCKSCHTKVHYKTLKLPDNVGILWTRRDTEKFLRWG